MIQNSELPKISCLLVTANGRLEYLKRSINCYFDQTYPNKQLVIVNEGPVEYQKQIEHLVLNRSDVKLVFLTGAYSLGALRNISIALASGEVFVQWDDDDFNTPERLSLQLNYLLKNPKYKVCYLSDQLHYYFNSNCLFWENWAMFCSGGVKHFSLIPGTIMAWKKDFDYRYPSAGQHCKAGEDSVLAYSIPEDNIILLSGFGCMQIYSYHGKNVWDLDHHMKLSMCRSMENSYLIQHKENICKTIDYLKLEDVVNVMGRNGLAFQHKAKL